MKKILVLAPHPDDEILLAGALIYTIKNDFEIYVGYMTNGDSKSNLGEIRINEAVESLKVLGVKESHIEFLGYGNNWIGNKHIYNMDEEEIATSMSNKQKTYGTYNYPEFAMKNYGKSNDYTRKNLKKDISAVIEKIWPDVIICVDYDSHPDHRALSLLFEEVMGALLKKQIGYTPIVLKKFAYAGMYYGVNDYYESPFKMTEKGSNVELLDMRFELDNPTYTWEERISLKVAKKAKTRSIYNNILYKAALKHKSQKIAERTGSFANGDAVYWQRRTDSITYRAKISATSGNVKYVNDFKRFDSPNVIDSAKGVFSLSSAAWIPEERDIEKKLFLDFENKVSVSRIIIYENIKPEDNIIRARIIFDTGKVIDINNICHTGGKTEVLLDTIHNVKHMEFQILQYTGKECGIAELEVYETVGEQEIPFRKLENKKKKKRTRYNTVGEFFDRFIHGINMNNQVHGKYYLQTKYLTKWSRISVKRIVEALINNNIHSVGLYGVGDLGIVVGHDLQKNGMNVVFGIDNLAGTIMADFPIYSKDNVIMCRECDAIIITVISEYMLIKKELREITGNKCILLELDEIICMGY